MRWWLLGLIALVASGSLAQEGSKRSLQEELDAIAKVKAPEWDDKRENEPDYRATYMKGLVDAAASRAGLILILYHDYPEAPETRKMMNLRWDEMQGFRNPPSKESIRLALDDIDNFLSARLSPELMSDAKFWRAFYQMYDAYPDPVKMRPPVEVFAKEYPKDSRAVRLWERVADFSETEADKMAVYRLIVKKFPHEKASRFFPGKIRAFESVGKPFKLSFTDAISGKKISVANFKGKVVAIDFWATWCGPCVAELPELKRIYAEYKDKGFAIIGVSLDSTEGDGGLKTLRDYVAKNDLPWPQFYQPKGWEGDFSRSWGINGIPALFLIDQKGNLVSVRARGVLEEEVKRLLGSGPGCHRSYNRS